MTNNNVTSVHWRFWVICAFALVWNGMGCVNFIMQTNAEALSSYPEAARVLVESRPAWATGAFAIAVFGGLLGCLLLLAKKSVAFYMYVGSLLGVVITNIHTYLAGASIEIWVGSLMSLVVGVFLVRYSKWVEAKGWVS